MLDLGDRLFHFPFGFGVGDRLFLITRTGLEAFFQGVEDAHSAGLELVLLFGAEQAGEQFKVHGVIGVEFLADLLEQVPLVGSQEGCIGVGGVVGEGGSGYVLVNPGQGVVEFVFFLEPDAPNFPQFFQGDQFRSNWSRLSIAANQILTAYTAA